MNILALDQATKTGWCNNTASGVWDFKVKRDESGGMRLIRFESKLQEIHDMTPLDLVVYERVAGRFKGAIIVASELVSVLKVFCEKNNIEYRAFSAGEIKRYATGKGNVNKPAMVAAMQKKYPYIEIIDDNHADAIALYDLANEEYGSIQNIEPN